MFQNFYDKVIVLSQKNRTDRRRHFEKNARDIGLMFEYFDSIDMSTSKESFNYSHYNILQNCAKEGIENILVLEDDCQFVSMSSFNDIHNELRKEDWSWIYYGANARPYPDHRQPSSCTKHLRLISAAYTTHAIGYTQKLISAILTAYNPENGEMYDAFLDRVILPYKAAHICVPFLCVQKPSFSDLWDRDVDYTDTFTASEDYLRNIC